MERTWAEIGAAIGAKAGPDGAGVDPTLIVVLIEVLTLLVKCYAEREDADPARLVRLARRRSRLFLRWLAQQVEDHCRSAREFTVLGGQHLVTAIRDELAQLNPDDARTVFYALANHHADQ